MTVTAVPLVNSARLRDREARLPPPIRQHCDEIAEADGIVVVHPNWWGQPPAMLKGWIDRVLRVGVAYRDLGLVFCAGRAGLGWPSRLNLGNVGESIHRASEITAEAM